MNDSQLFFLQNFARNGIDIYGVLFSFLGPPKEASYLIREFGISRTPIENQMFTLIKLPNE